MKPTTRLLLVTMMVCFILGGAIRFFVSGGAGAHSASEMESKPNSENAETDKRKETERPGLVEVSEIRGNDAPELLAQFLKDATFDEVTDLIQSTSTGETRLEQWMWMILVRGLELDAERLLVWIKEEYPRRNYLPQLFELWSGMEPKAAFLASLQEEERMSTYAMKGLHGEALDEAMAAIKETKPGSLMIRSLEELKWTQLAKDDISKALSDTEAIENRIERKRILATVIKAWADENPIDAVHWLEEQKSLDNANTLMTLAIEKLASINPVLAREKLNAVPPSRNRSLVEGEVMNEWAGEDPEAALNWVKEMPASINRDYLFSSIVGQLEKEPSEVLELIKELGINVRHSDPFRTIEVQGSLDSLKNNPYSIDRHYALTESLRHAASELAKDSPEKAFEMLYLTGNINNGEEAVAAQWIERDPIEAAEWAASLPETDFTASVKTKIFDAWSQQSPEEAAMFLSEHGLASDIALSHGVAVEWARRDPGAALEWAAHLEGDGRSELIEATTIAASQVDPVLALQHLDLIENAEIQEQVLSAATNSWRKDDPGSMMQWLQSQPMESDVNELFVKQAKAWVLDRPKDASEWIQAMDDGLRKDQAITGMLDALTSSSNPSKDFIAAESWVRTIADPELQEQWMEEIGKRR